MIRSQSMSLQIPLNADCTRSVSVTPFLSPSSSSICSSVPENCPEYQRVTISGDYCAGVSVVGPVGFILSSGFTSTHVKSFKSHMFVDQEPGEKDTSAGVSFSLDEQTQGLFIRVVIVQ